MKKVKVLSALSLLVVAGAAHADVSGTATLVNDYDFRGITQSGFDPAVQVSIDYSHAIGFYAGAWASNVNDFTDWDGLGTATTELDIYAGFKQSYDTGFGWDAGAVYYGYPGASGIAFYEIYGKASFKWFTGGLYYTPDYIGGEDETPPPYSGGAATYFFGDVNIPAGPLTVGLHAGISSGDGIEQLFGGVEDSYTDYAVGVTYSASKINLGIKWVATDMGDVGSDDRLVVSIGTALPW